MKLLLVEDSARLRRSLVTGLSRSGFAVDPVADGEDALRYALAADYDVVVLDLMLPKLGGLDVLREMRRAGRGHHVLVLSARDQTADRIEALRLGADDYLVKPFAFDELVARIRALVRRRYDSKAPVLEIGRLRLNTALHVASVDEHVIPLTPREIGILEYLALHRGQVIAVAQLEDRIYESTAAVTRNAIEAHVSGLRRKLRAVLGESVVKTRRGFGYFID